MLVGTVKLETFALGVDSVARLLVPIRADRTLARPAWEPEETPRHSSPPQSALVRRHRPRAPWVALMAAADAGERMNRGVVRRLGPGYR